MQAYEAQLKRLKQALNVDSDTAFSQILDVSQGSVSGAKKRGQIPHSWFFQVSEKTGYSIDWLFRGTDSMDSSETACPQKEQTLDEGPSHEGTAPCERCQRLEKKLDALEDERRELSTENRQLLKEISELKLNALKLAHQLDTARKMCCEYDAAIKAAGLQNPVFSENPISESNDYK